MKRIAITITMILVLVAVMSTQGQRDRYAGEPTVVTAGEDTFFAMKTIIKTVSVNDDASVDDSQFDDDAENSTAQNLNMGTLIPAWGEIVSAQVRCIESVGAGTFQVILGTSGGGNQILAQATIDGITEIAATAAGESPEIASSASSLTIFMQGDPDAGTDWDEIGAGRWAVSITYIDYNAVYSANP